MSETVKQKKTEKEHLNMKRVILHNVSVTLLIMGISTVMAQAFFHFSRNSTSVAIIYVLVNLFTDLSYRFLDPRIRLGGMEQ